MSAYTVTCREFLHHSVHAGPATLSYLGSTGITWSCACPPSHKKPMSHCFGLMPGQIHCSAHDMAGRGFFFLFFFFNKFLCQNSVTFPRAAVLVMKARVYRVSVCILCLSIYTPQTLIECYSWANSGGDGK